MTGPPPRAPLRAPRGTQLSCRNWLSEAALRMLLNNLDPQVAERPEDLVVYGGVGQGARHRRSFGAVVAGARGPAGGAAPPVPVGQPRGGVRPPPGAPP